MKLYIQNMVCLRCKFGAEMIIPAHASHRFHARKQFKMISTVIKSGYED